MKGFLRLLGALLLAGALLLLESGCATAFSIRGAVDREMISSMVRSTDLSALTAELIREEDPRLQTLLTSEAVEDYLCSYLEDWLLRAFRGGKTPAPDAEGLREAILQAAREQGTVLEEEELQELEQALVSGGLAGPEQETVFASAGIGGVELRLLRLLCGPWSGCILGFLSLALGALLARLRWKDARGLNWCAVPTLASGLMMAALGAALTGGQVPATVVSFAFGEGVRLWGWVLLGLALALILASGLLNALLPLYRSRKNKQA